MNQEQIHLSTNRNNPSCRWKNYLFNLKTKGKMSAAFVCNTSGCYASVSLRVVNFEIIEPFEITHQNENHKVDSKPPYMKPEHHKRNSNLKQLKDLLNDELADTDESDDQEVENGDESDEEYGDTPQPSQPLCELRVQINEDDVTTKKNKKEKCEICNKEFLRLKTHMIRIHRQ
ncbi:unnamed protein product [Brachionus calyciflorus]|uniref:Uncharacterized protein n=1 Tax=Brachionus calyciflorus TaxID=104777 RepID=A0A813ZMH7_9BILA|nr:unnamed protein product [Brachionus calyciflorus]